jgi:starvation-inducible DNA-binding protein
VTEQVDRGGLAVEELQEELRDLLSLAVFCDHVRWVLVGDEAAELDEWLADAIPQWRALADRVARHMVTLGVAPDGRVRSLAKDITAHWVPKGWLRSDEAGRLVAHRLGAMAGWACYRQSQATNPETVQVLGAVCSTLDLQADAGGDLVRASSTRDTERTEAVALPAQPEGRPSSLESLRALPTMRGTGP